MRQGSSYNNLLTKMISTFFHSFSKWVPQKDFVRGNSNFAITKIVHNITIHFIFSKPSLAAIGHWCQLLKLIHSKNICHKTKLYCPKNKIEIACF